MFHGLLQLRPFSTLPVLPARHSRRSVCRLPACAASNNDNQQPKKPETPSSLEELLQQQQQQIDNYRPPQLVAELIDSSKDKFLGRLATLILGVHLLQHLNSMMSTCPRILHDVPDMVDLQAGLLGERITGHGAVEQLEISATGVSLWEVEPLLGALVLGLIAAALWPPTKKQQEQKKSVLSAWLQNITGRAACLGLAATVTGEVLTGKVSL